MIINNIIRRGEGDGIKVSKSSGITIVDNTVSGGGDSESAIYLVGATDAVVQGNLFSDIESIGIVVKGGSSGIGGAGIRFIGAQDVEVVNNTVTDAKKYVTIDAASKFHESWFADDIVFSGNTFEDEDWLINRSEGANIEISDPPIDEIVTIDQTSEITTVVDPIESDGTSNSFEFLSNPNINVTGEMATPDTLSALPPEPLVMRPAELDMETYLFDLVAEIQGSGSWMSD